MYKDAIPCWYEIQKEMIDIVMIVTKIQTNFKQWFSLPATVLTNEHCEYVTDNSVNYCYRSLLFKTNCVKNIGDIRTLRICVTDNWLSITSCKCHLGGAVYGCESTDKISETGHTE